jgi:hypothetical protein
MISDIILPNVPTPAVMTDPTLSIDDELFLVTYFLVDELYQEAAPDWVRFWPGSDRMRMSDSEIICLLVM